MSETGSPGEGQAQRLGVDAPVTGQASGDLAQVEIGSGEGPSASGWTRWLSLGLAWALSLGVLAPVLFETRDNFPFSTYPMFTSNRERVDLMVMLYSDDPSRLLEGTRVPPAWIAGEEVMMATATIKRATWAGPAGMSRLCAEVRAKSEGEGLRALAFVVETMDVRAIIDKVDAPHTRRIHFLCPASGGSL